MVTSVAMTPWAEWIERHWRESGLTVTAFATRIGVSHVTFMNWVDKGFRPQRDTAVKVARALKLDEDEALVAAGYRRPDQAPEESPARTEAPGILLFGGGEHLTPEQKDELARRCFWVTFTDRSGNTSSPQPNNGLGSSNNCA